MKLAPQLRRLLALLVITGWLCVAVAWCQDDDDNLIPSVVQLPTFGVAIDADGVLALKTFTDPGFHLRAKRMAAARAELEGAIWRPTKLRKISLRRLEMAIAAAVKEGKPLPQDIKHLAGLQRVQYVFTYEPEGDRSGDIIIAGPAEGWIADAAGRMVGASTGRPVLLLEDLAVALRAYPPGTRDRPFLGCTIDPTAEGLARLVAFQKTIPRTVSTAERGAVGQRILEGTRESLGLADIRTFGVAPRTHFAQVLIEADFRMKRIAIGAEPPPIPMVTFLEALESPRQAMLQRWWFTPDYDCVKATEDRLAMEMIGEGVKLQAEDIRISAGGTLAGPQKPSRASQRYCDAFTRKYSDIAAATPVYAQLRCMIDLAVLGAYLRNFDLYERADLPLDTLRDEDFVACETLDEPKRVPCVSTAVWKRNRLICPAGGGVAIEADTALDDAHMQIDESGALTQLRDEVVRSTDKASWWWD